jgi:hypothetical protein
MTGREQGGEKKRTHISLGIMAGRTRQDWRWSSTSAHLRGRDDGLTALAPIRDRFPRFGDLLDTGQPGQDLFEPPARRITVHSIYFARVRQRIRIKCTVTVFRDLIK